MTALLLINILALPLPSTMILFFSLLAMLIHAIQPFLTPICFVIAWSIVLFGIWIFFSATREGVKHVKHLHQIPCANCQFFTNSYYLKCPVHPSIALSEEAIGCRDFEGSCEMGNRSVC
jgi:hypothetical protein